MKKINSLAKILFFFFAIASFSLLIVGCNDDEECDNNSLDCYACKGSIIEKNVHIDGCILKVNENYYWFKESNEDIVDYYVCNVKTMRNLLKELGQSEDYIIEKKVQLDLIMDIKEFEGETTGLVYAIVVRSIKIHE